MLLAAPFLLAVLVPQSAAGDAAPREAWERAFLAQLDEIASLRDAVWSSKFDEANACFPQDEHVRRPLAPAPAKVTELVLPVLGRLAEEDADSSVREAARVALASVQEREWSERPADALHALGWTVDAATLERVGLALEQLQAAPDALAPLSQTAALRVNDPLREQFASKLAQHTVRSQRERIGRLFVIGAVAAPATGPTSATLHDALFEALDDESDAASFARLALARCASRVNVSSSRTPAHLDRERTARIELRRRFDDLDPSRRRATWLAAAWLERGRARVREADDAELLTELRKRFHGAKAALDVAASSLSLALVDDRESLPALRERFADPSAPRAYLALALALFDDGDSVEPIEAWAHGAEVASQRLDGSVTLALIGDKREPNVWGEKLYDRATQPTRETAFQLAAIGDTRAVAPLIGAICRTDLSVEVRVELIRALADVCGPNSPRRSVSRWFTGR